MPALDVIAYQMRDYARTHPFMPGQNLSPYTLRLRTGLQITCLYESRTNTWRVDIARRDEWPGSDECKLVEQNFNIPPAAERRELRYQTSHIVRYIWLRAIYPPPRHSQPPITGF